MTFDLLGLSPEVLKAVGDAGYETPTPIQKQAVPQVLMGRDVLGCAQTGTGKTASFTLPMIDILASGRARARMPRSVVITPTRELAAQIADNFETYGKYHRLTMALLIGGSSFTEQERLLDRGVDVLIATPGRLIDLFERGKILLADVKILVIDEADRMLDMGFIPDVERIVSVLPPKRQTLFFSATMPAEIRRLADAFLKDPKEIKVDPPDSAAETVEQYLLRVGGGQKEKRAALRQLLKRDDVTSAIIFCNRKRNVDLLNKSLAAHNFSCVPLHGDMAQPVRMETLEKFRNGEVSLLVCSDVAARGLDIPVVSHVFNFEVPISAEDYIHRIGRTGRAGRSGKAFMLATADEALALNGVEKLIGKPIEQIELADGEGWDNDSIPLKDRRRRSRGGAPKRPAQPASKSAQPASKPARTAAKSEPAASKANAKPAEDTPKEDGSKDQTSQPFGEHTPAFLLKPLRVA
jgi:superfamily II DNA/RNA helicase